MALHSNALLIRCFFKTSLRQSNGILGFWWRKQLDTWYTVLRCRSRPPARIYHNLNKRRPPINGTRTGFMRFNYILMKTRALDTMTTLLHSNGTTGICKIPSNHNTRNDCFSSRIFYSINWPRADWFKLLFEWRSCVKGKGFEEQLETVSRNAFPD